MHYLGLEFTYRAIDVVRISKAVNTDLGLEAHLLPAHLSRSGELVVIQRHASIIGQGWLRGIRSGALCVCVVCMYVCTYYGNVSEER